MLCKAKSIPWPTHDTEAVKLSSKLWPPAWKKMDSPLTRKAQATLTFGGLNLAGQPEALSKRKVKVSELEQKLRSLNIDRSNLISEISEYEAFSQIDSEATMLALRDDIDHLSEKIKSIADKSTEIKRRIAREANGLCRPIIFWKYLLSDQIKSRALLALLQNEEAVTKEELDAHQASMKLKYDALSKERIRSESHRGFDVSHRKLDLESCDAAIRATATSLETAQFDLTSLDAKLAPHLFALEKIIAEIGKCDDDLLLANKYNSALKKASEDANARRNIHMQCEDYFGEGRPSKVIDEISSKKLRSSRDLQKMEQRIYDQIRKHELDIESIIIDGNNACYTSGNEFIGLSALRGLALHLRLKFVVTVVFDASIRKLLKASPQDIQKNLGSKISTYVAPSKDAADEYILKLAEGNERSYIVSNDRYSEWRDYAAVRDSRVLNFLIVSGKVMINDIDVSIDF